MLLTEDIRHAQVYIVREIIKDMVELKFVPARKPASTLWWHDKVFFGGLLKDE